jgi:hypothetical protein
MNPLRAKARAVLAFVMIVGFILVTGAFFAVLFFGDHIGLPEGDMGKQIIGMLGLVVGTWNAGTLMVLTFHFGTSQGSVDKNKLIDKELTAK